MDYRVQLSNIEKSTYINGITGDSINYVLYNLLQSKDFITLIVNNNLDLELAAKEIEFYSKDIEVLKFPEWNTIPYDINSPQIKIQTERMETIYNLMNYDTCFSNTKVLLIISMKSIVQKVIDSNDFSCIKLRIGDKISINELQNFLESNCYSNVDTAYDIGNYTINNNICDIITFENKSYRIFFKNNKIHEIKSFNPITQIAERPFKEVLILPIREIILTKNNINNFKQNYRNLFGISHEINGIYDSISNNIFHDGAENWLPLFYTNKLVPIFNYIPKKSIVAYKIDLFNRIDEHLQNINKFYNLRAEELTHKENTNIYRPIPNDMLYINNEELKSLMDKYTNVIFNTDNIELNKERQMNISVKGVPNFFRETKEVVKAMQEYLHK